MVQVEWNHQKIKISGHANFAPKGEDIVCAGVSSIIYGALNWFDPQTIKVDIDNRTSTINLEVIDDFTKNKSYLELIIKQLEALEANYQEYIKIRKVKD